MALPRWEAADATSSEVWDEATAARYDDESAGMFAPEVLGPALDVLESLAEGGPVLELAIGTGRVAVPLLDRGLSVTGIELSAPMLAQLRTKVAADSLPVVLGDMATTEAPGAGGFSLVCVVWNALSNLRVQDEQVACFRNAARHLRPGGRFVVELWVPPLHRLVPGQRAVPMSLDDEHLVLDTYDTATQACASHHYVRQPDGAYRYGVGRFRYVWPSECDLMAQLAGMALESRWSGRDRAPFDSTSENHVSVWRVS